MSLFEPVVTLSIKSVIRDLRPIIDVLLLDHPKQTAKELTTALVFDAKIIPKGGAGRQTTYATYQLNYQSQDVFGMWNKER